MSLSEWGVISFSVLASILGVVAAAFSAWVLFRRRDKAYREKYREFLRQKSRVEEKLEKEGRR
jgi:uncharacterized membrane protein YccC